MADIHFFTDIDLINAKPNSTSFSIKLIRRTTGKNALFLFFGLMLPSCVATAQIPEVIQKMDVIELPYEASNIKVPIKIRPEDEITKQFFRKLSIKELIEVNGIETSPWGEPLKGFIYHPEEQEINIYSKLIEEENFILVSLFSGFKDPFIYQGYLISLDYHGNVIDGLITEFHAGNNNGGIDRKSIVTDSQIIKITETSWSEVIEEPGDHYTLETIYKIDSSGNIILKKKCISY
ncbi:MAG: hypothetical protein RIG77_20740 [Cyclobacteriaceae bacterium]